MVTLKISRNGTKGKGDSVFSTESSENKCLLCEATTMDIISHCFVFGNTSYSTHSKQASHNISEIIETTEFSNIHEIWVSLCPHCFHKQAWKAAFIKGVIAAILGLFLTFTLIFLIKFAEIKNHQTVQFTILLMVGFWIFIIGFYYWKCFYPINRPLNNDFIVNTLWLTAEKIKKLNGFNAMLTKTDFNDLKRTSK